MGIRRVNGRDFDDRDRKEAENVFIVNSELSRRFFADRNPVGERLMVDYFGRPVEGSIVGIVGNVRHGGPADELRPTIYASYLQFPSRRMTILVRSRGRSDIAAALRSEIQSLDRELPAGEFLSLESLDAEAIATPRLRILVLGILGGLALALATLGIYGVVSYSTAIRKQEIGVRMALGARPAEILLMILRQGARLCLWGILGCVILEFGTGRLLASHLFGVSTLDFSTYLIVAALLILIGVLASLRPASNAIDLPPAIVLKGD
jgi:putative ABC transport system permease protein